MHDFGLILILAIVSISGIVAQTTSDLSLPQGSDDVISVDISNMHKTNRQELSNEFLSVYVTNDSGNYDTAIAIQGNFSITENRLNFRPYYPFETGLPYMVKLKEESATDYAYYPFQLKSKEKVDQAMLLRIYPTDNLLPENVLRFYFYFQTPMKQEEALKHIKLIDEEGLADDHAFMKFKEELWSNDGKRLTLLFDPGRIKRGVSTNTVKGPALENGHKYHLSISDEWQDVHGQNLIVNSIKEISVVDACRKKINLQEWIITKPQQDSHDRLIIDFDRIMDHTLLQSMIQIRNSADVLVEVAKR